MSRCRVLAIFVCAVSTLSLAQTAPSAAEHLDKHLQTEIPKWLAAGEHQDVSWKVKIEKPIETYQLRQIVRVTALIDAAVLQSQSVRRNLVFILKVADEQGQWLPGENFATETLVRSLGNGQNLEMSSEVFLKPGKYTIGAMFYDSVLDQHNLTLIPLEVPAPKKDPLPDLLRDVRPAEFVRGDLNGSNSLGEDSPYLPVHNRRPLRIDLLVDLSTREEEFRPFQRPPEFSHRHRPGQHRPAAFQPTDDKTYIISLLESASVLSAMKPDLGCVQVSALDAFKERIILSPTPATGVEWAKVEAQLLGTSKDTIDIRALSDKKDEPKFFLRSLEALTSGAASCDAAKSAKPLHVLIVLSHGLHFRDGSEKVRPESCACQTFYLRQSDTVADSDDLRGTLSTLSPRMLDFHDPGQFRQRLATLMTELEALAK